MADKIKINTSRLKNDASEIKDHINAINKKVGELRSHNAVLDGMWDGPSSDVFKMAFESDINALETILQALGAMNEYEENARQRYDECEEKVADLVNQIKVS